jgi:hypothetical protein
MFSYPKGRNPLSITNQGEDGRRFSLNNKPRGRREMVLLILKEEILSITNQGEGPPYPKERNPLSTTNPGENRRFPLS